MYSYVYRLKSAVAVSLCPHRLRCSTLQHLATPYNNLQHTALHILELDVHNAPPCFTLQHPATPCNTLQHTAMLYMASSWMFLWVLVSATSSMNHTAVHCNTLQHFATLCNTLQSCTSLQVGFFCEYVSATSTLQHNAPPCNALQRPAPCNTMQHTAILYIASSRIFLWVLVSLTSKLHHTAPPCNTLHHSATRCNTIHRCKWAISVTTCLQMRNSQKAARCSIHHIK